MTAPPVFAGLDDYRARLGDTAFWWPHLSAILGRHGLAADASAVEAGVGSTYPTFLCGAVAIKLFGGWARWRRGFAAERAIQHVLAGDTELRVPRLLAEGRLFDGEEADWPYLVTTRMPGVAWERADLSERQRIAVAERLGEQVARLHALAAPDQTAWPALDPVEACRRSSLPAALLGGIGGFTAALPPSQAVLVHGDLMERHVFVANGAFAGIIDWGDAMAADRHYELAKLHLGLFDGDRKLLAAFLEAGGWPVDDTFAQRALAEAIRRQAVGLVQHPTMDVFHRLPAILGGREVTSLEELAAVLFAA